MQTRGVAAMNKTIIFFDEFHRLAAIVPGLAGDIFVTVENDLRREGRMAAHPDRDMSPVLIPDMKIVMIHIRPRFLPFDIADLAFPGLMHLPNRPGARPTRTRNRPRPTLCSARYSSAVRCFFSPRSQSITATALACAQPRNRRLKRPAMRIRCSLSSLSSDPYSDRHQFRKPPPPPTPAK